MNLTNTAALPLSVMIALFGLALMWGWAGEGALIALGWCGVLRIGEILQATSADLILPQDAAPGVWHVLLRIPVPKTRGRSAKHPPSRIDSEDVVSLPTAVFGRLAPCSNLWPSVNLAEKVCSAANSAWPRFHRKRSKAPLQFGLSSAWRSHILVAGHRGR